MNIILGITGSISAYKPVEIMRLFQKNNHHVCVILTRAAQKFIPVKIPGCGSHRAGSRFPGLHSTEGRGRLPAAEKIYEFWLNLKNA